MNSSKENKNMSCILWKGFNLCFSKFKCFPTIAYSPPPTAVDELDKDREFSANDPSILKNFNSLYDPNSYGSDHDLSTPKSLPFSSSTAAGAATTDDIFSSSSGEESVPDFTSAFATNRFFVSSPGSSNSIFGPKTLETPEEEEEDSVAVVSGGVAVETYSPDPYYDFRKSMVEMIEARDSTADSEFMNELLLCYLSLNPKHTHKFILGAFSDVIVSMVLPPQECRNCRLPGHFATSLSSI